MALDPLSLLILLFFLAVVALALTLWFLLTLGQRRLEPPRPKKAPVRKAAQAVPVDLNNDDFRGAKAKPKPPAPERQVPEQPPLERPPSKRDDAFERFIKSKNDELEF